MHLFCSYDYEQVFFIVIPRNLADGVSSLTTQITRGGDVHLLFMRCPKALLMIPQGANPVKQDFLDEFVYLVTGCASFPGTEPLAFDDAPTNGERGRGARG